jgi:hypothetical protein
MIPLINTVSYAAQAFIDVREIVVSALYNRLGSLAILW